MATIKIGGNRDERYYDFAKGAGSAVTDEVEMTYTDTLKTKDLVIILEKMIDLIKRDGTI